MSAPTKEKRKFFRHPIHVPIRLRFIDEDKTAVSESTDLSLGGLCFLWKKRLTKGKLLMLTIPVKEKIFDDIKAKVAYSREDRKTAHYRTGVAFMDAPSAFKAKLAEEALQILQYQKELGRELGHEVSEEEAADRWIRRFAESFNTIRL